MTPADLRDILERAESAAPVASAAAAFGDIPGGAERWETLKQHIRAALRAERDAPDGPWEAAIAPTGGWHLRRHLDAHAWSYIGGVVHGRFTEAEALAVRDALNRLARGTL